MALRVGSGLPNIQKTALSYADLNVPSRREQKQIGTFFKQLDKLKACWILCWNACVGNIRQAIF